MIGWQRLDSSASTTSAAPKSCISGNIEETDIDDSKDCSISDVIQVLKSSFRADVFRKAEEMLMLRECRLVKERAEVEGSLKRLELDYQARCTSLEAELESCRRHCGKLEERNRNAEVDFERRMDEEEERRSLVERKLGEAELAKRAAESELEYFKGLFRKLEESTTRLKEDRRVMRERERWREEMIGTLQSEAQEKFTQISELKTKNRDLERARCKAASDFEESKKRCKELEERVSQIDGEKSYFKSLKNRKLSSGNVSGSEETGDNGSSRKKGEENADHGTVDQEKIPFRPVNPIPVASASRSPVEGKCTPSPGGQTGGKFREQLSFKEDEALGRKRKPAVMQDANSKLMDEVVLVIGDDEEFKLVPMSSIKSSTPVPSGCVSGRSTEFTMEKTFTKSSNSKSNKMRKIIGADNDRRYEGTLATDRDIYSKTAATYEEDDIPLSQLLSKKIKEAPATPKRPSNAPPGLEFDIATALSSTHEIVEESVTPSKMLSVAPKAKEVECGSTRTFFLAGNELSPKTGELSRSNIAEDEIDGDKTAISKEETDSDTSLGEFLEKMRRDKQSQKWEYEADMLSSFSKDPLLCMSAVCAIYRQQISNKQSVQQSRCVKNRGFLMFDMLRGSELALYLMDGDCMGPLKKSVEELKKHNSEAVDYCSQLASRYSKQLFQIYQDQEDLFFP